MINGPAEKAHTMVAHELWKQTLGQNASEETTINRVKRWVELLNAPDALRDIGQDWDTSSNDFCRMVHKVFWLHGGCVTLTAGHKYAAALCATRMDRDSVDDVELPAMAFRVTIPDGVIVHEAKSLELLQVNVVLTTTISGVLFEGRNGSKLMIIPVVFTGGKNRMLDFLTSNEEDGADLWVGEFEHPRAAEVLSQKDVRMRMALLARRLTVGLLLSYTHTNHWKERVIRTTSSGERRGPPPHRVISFGTPINMDVRPALHEYVGGTRANGAPSVQSLVRGHYKRQVVGVARSGRKVIWVEPYWRGPEDAPILARPYKVG